ncbi:MAG TPA: hypothetical protein VJP85_10765 [Candidatus Baltobacteraceae bacterium]|nr:hypothetical protein [Candidatus Baltobacteraceae bacterium]
MARKHPVRTFLHTHGLSVAAVGILSLWLVLYSVSNEKTHLGAFFGNAIADWSGSVVIILGTKFLIERGSSESKQKPPPWGGIAGFFYEHSLLLFLTVTAIAWALLFARSDPQSKWGQVAGNVLSEWVQMAGLVFLTKELIERGSKESRR